MKRLVLLFAMLIGVALVAGAACWLTARIMARRSSVISHTDAHQWIHGQLALTAEQEKAMAPLEQRYEDQKRHGNELINLANMELAQAILTDKGDSPRVRSAIAKIHEAQGELQNATVQHVFEMRVILRPEQYDKLLNLTANALYQVQRER